MRAHQTPVGDALQIRFWGVRGSYPVSGRRSDAFGGHTACVEVRCGQRLFIIDAGTGLIELGATLIDKGPPEIDLLLSHLHIDHILGLPFFKPALFRDRKINLHCGNLEGASCQAALNRIFAPPLFPVTLTQLPAQFSFHDFRAGEPLTFADIEVLTCPLVHPSGATGFRFNHHGRSVCYVSDIEHTEPWPPPDLIAFVKDADLVIYDAMFSEDEYCRCRGWGHSTSEAGLALCRAAGAKALAAFHLHPHHSDHDLRILSEALDKALPGSFVAQEGQVLTFAPAALAPVA